MRRQGDFPRQTEAIKGEHANGILAAYRLFRTAYEEKGRLALRDKPATFAERCAYLIRNDVSEIPETYGPKKNKTPRFPLTAPWPMLTFLAAIDEPLREREDLLERLKKNGEFHGYGEYIGPIAQQTEFQRARRLAPYAFGYHAEPTNIGRDSMQMMLKDGGVCGTMAAMEVCTYDMLGVPATTAGQPGHCALIHAARDARTRKFLFDGDQYVTAGHEGTHPHTPWYFGDIDKPEPMVWHQSVAFSVNYGVPAFLESLTAWEFYTALPEEARKAHGRELLESAITINPFDMALADAAVTTGQSASDLLRVWDKLRAAVISSSARSGNVATGKSKSGNSEGGLYLKTLEDRLADHLKTLTPPVDKSQADLMAALIRRRTDDLSKAAAEKAAKKKG